MTDWFDRARFDQEWAADQEVLTRLAEQGDRSEQPRNVDVSFIGARLNLDAAEHIAHQNGFRTIRCNELDGDWRLDVCREQPATLVAIRRLTIIALQIEAACGVFYDGWGCITQNDRA